VCVCVFAALFLIMKPAVWINERLSRAKSPGS
jgi:hypothetical protein